MSKIAGFEWMELLEHFHKVFEAVAAKRDAYGQLVNHPLYPKQTCTQWHLNEVEAMWHEINRLRKCEQLPEIGIHEVFSEEAQACGHSDYVQKFCLYCAELTRGIKPRHF